MAILLPTLAGVLLFLLCQRQAKDWRDAVLAGAIRWGVLLTLITEILSLFYALHFAGLVITWLLIDCGLIVLLWLTGGVQQISLPQWAHRLRKRLDPRSPIPTEPLKHQQKYPYIANPFHGFLLIYLGLNCGVLAIVALISPPNNWDAMAYTMPRVVHWMQNHSVAHYPTHYTPQLHSNPWAEFALLHLQILSGGDRWANLLQWLCMVGTLVGVSLIAETLGATRKGELYAIVLCATLPSGILQASNAKNTYVVAFWLVCFVYYGLAAVRTRLTKWQVGLMGASLGLAVLTKGTAYAFAFPFVIWFSYLYVKNFGFRVFRYLPIALSLFLSLNIGHYARNLEMFGSPTTTFPYHLTNETYTVGAIASNLIRNTGLHWSIPVIFDGEQAEKAILYLHHFLNIDPQDPATTFYAGAMQIGEKFKLPPFAIFEDTAGNPLHFWLIPILGLLVLACKRLRKNSFLLHYFLVVLASFLMFCLLFKWQPWHSRLHLPFFVFLCPVFGYVLSGKFNKKLGQYILILFIFFSSPYLIYNEVKPLVGTNSEGSNIFTTDRTSEYFAARFDIQTDYLNAAGVITDQNCRSVGLLSRPDAWEYPLWVLLNRRSPVRLEHINVQNPSTIAYGTPPYRSFIPCAIVSIGQPSVERLAVNGQSYESRWRSQNTLDPMQVFIPSR